MRKLNLVMIIVWSLVALLILTALVGGILYRSTSSAGSKGIIGSADGPTSLFTASGSRALLVDEAIPLDGVTNIRISLSSETVDILPAEDNHLRVVQYGINLEPRRIIEVQKSGGSIDIRRTDNGWNRFSLFNFGGMINHSWVEVYLPASYQRNLEVGLTSGDLRLGANLKLQDFSIDIFSGTIKSGYSITAGDAKIDMTSGTMNLMQLDAGVFDIEVSSGTITIENLAGSGEVQITSGTMKLHNVAIADSLDVGCSSGVINISLADDPSLQFRGQVSSGNLHTYFDKYSKGEHSKEYFATVGDGPYKTLTAVVTSGSIKIESANGSTSKSTSFGRAYIEDDSLDGEEQDGNDRNSHPNYR